MNDSTTATTEAPPAFADHDALTMLEDLLSLDRRLVTEVATFTATGPGAYKTDAEVEVMTDVIESSMTDLIVEVRQVWDGADEGQVWPVLGRYRVTVEEVSA